MKILAKSGLIAVIFLSACGSNPSRYVVEAPVSAQPLRLRVSTLELRDVQLPAYGSENAILAQEADGALRALKGVEWADSSVEAVTAELARSLDMRTTASVAAEPWPLSTPAQARLEVRLERMIARNDGVFSLAGQFAVAAPDGQLREFIDRFDIRVPLAGQSAADITASYGVALQQLSDQILRRLAR